MIVGRISNAFIYIDTQTVCFMRVTQNYSLTQSETIKIDDIPASDRYDVDTTVS